MYRTQIIGYKPLTLWDAHPPVDINPQAWPLMRNAHLRPTSLRSCWDSTSPGFNQKGVVNKKVRI